MSEPLTFPSAAPRFGLPLLFAGQAQKEFFVNQSLALADALLHPAIEGTLATPPADPAEGESWLIAEAATDEWLGKDGWLASRAAGVWIFAPPTAGMQVFDSQAGHYLRRLSDTWQCEAAPALPTGGETIDAESRQAIADLIQALRNMGVFPDE